MKKIVFLLTCATLLFSGCVKVQNDDVVPEQGKRIATLKAEIDNPDTRVGVSIGQNETTATYSWQADDRILVSAIFTNELGSMYTKREAGIRSGSISQNGGIAHFEVELEDGLELGKYAFYPVNWWCDAFPEGINFGLSPYYIYDEGVANVPMLGTITSTGVIFRPVCGLLKVTIENIPTDAHFLHFSVDGKKITGCFPVAGSPGNQYVSVENLGENYQETDGDYIDIRFGGEGEEGGDFPGGGEGPEGGEGGTIGLRSPMTFYIPLPCGKYNNLSFSICGRDSDDPLFTRIARMDNNRDGIYSDEEGLEIKRNEIVVAPTLEFAWDRNPPRSIVLDVNNNYQYEEALDENGVLHLDQYDAEIGFTATIKGKYSRALEAFDPDLISCQLVNVTDPENVVRTPVTFEYAEDYDFDNDFDRSEVILNMSIPTDNVGEFKLEVSYGTLAPVESFKVKVYPVVPIPAALGEDWAYHYYFSPQVHVTSEWFKPYWTKDSNGNVYLRTRAASARSEALLDYAFRGSFTDEAKGGSFDAFAYFTQITSIPTNAFWGCEYLTGITFPSGITSIGTDAFRYCDSLTEVELPAGLTSIGNYAFADCYHLTSMQLPSGVKTSIGDFAFNYSWRLKSINLDNVSSIGQSAFAGCDALTEINIGDAAIGYNAFGGCDELNRVTIGSSDPDCTATIGNYAFDGCEKLSEVNLVSVSSIGEGAFEWCLLNNITLSNNLTTIGARAFWGSSLGTITIPATVTSIGDNAFAYCYSLDYVEFESSTPPHVEDIAGCFLLDEGMTPKFKIYVPSSEALAAYQSAWAAIEDYIEVKPANL